MPFERNKFVTYSARPGRINFPRDTLLGSLRIYIHGQAYSLVTNLWMLYVSYYIRTVYIIKVSNEASPIGIGSTMKRIVE